MRRTHSIVFAIGACALAAAFFFARLANDDQGSISPSSESMAAERTDPPSSAVDECSLAAAIRDHRSGAWVEATVRVTKLLPDDRDGERHQRWLVRDGDDHSILVAHNIELAPRVPLRAGDEITLRGRFEWNVKGGVVHWTHRDPTRASSGGWIRHRGRVYE